MVTIRLKVMVGEDHQALVQLPTEIPVGMVEWVVQAKSTPLDSTITVVNLEREVVRQKLIAADLHSAAHHVNEDIQPLSIEDRLIAGQLPIGRVRHMSLFQKIGMSDGDFFCR